MIMLSLRNDDVIMSTNLSSPLQRVISNSKSLRRLLFDLSLIANFSCSDSRARRCSAESASICRSRAKESKLF